MLETGGNQSLNTSASQSTNSINLQKALHILGVIRSLPSGSLIYKQIEQILLEYGNQQIHVEHVYVKFLHALLNVLQSQVSEKSSLIIRLKLLQARLQPPLIVTDELLENDFEQCLSDLVQELGCSTNEANQLFQSGVSDSQYIEEEIELTSNTVPQYDDSTFHQEPKKSRNSILVESLADVHDINNQEISDLRDTLSYKLREAMQQNQDFCTMLDLAETELQQVIRAENLNDLKQQILVQVGRLHSSSQKIVEVFERADQYLGNVEVDYKQLDEELNRARLLSLTDDLTELPNRRAFLSKLENEVGRVRRHNQPLSLAIIDLDKFKSINDQHGHAIGDEVLRCYANDIFSIFRQYDMVARFGGEEFAVLLPNTDRKGALCALSKVKEKVSQVYCEVNNLSIPIPSFSAGLAEYINGETLGAYIERADQAMYKAKSLGRDRIEFDSE